MNYGNIVEIKMLNLSKGECTMKGKIIGYVDTEGWVGHKVPIYDNEGWDNDTPTKKPHTEYVDNEGWYPNTPVQDNEGWY